MRRVTLLSSNRIAHVLQVLRDLSPDRPDILAIVGAALIVRGVSLLSVPAAFMTAGTLLIVAGVISARAAAPRKER